MTVGILSRPGLKLGLGTSTPIAGEYLTGTGAGTSQWLPPFDRVHDHSSALDGASLAPSAGVYFNSYIAPAALTADQNDWNPNGGMDAFFWAVNCGAAGRNIHGMVAPPIKGLMRWIYNWNANNLVFKQNSGTCPVAADRLFLPSNLDLTVGPGDGALFLYSPWPTLTGWVAIGL